MKDLSNFFTEDNNGGRGDAQLNKHESVTFEILEEGAMVLCSDISQETHFLNAAGAAIFRLCNGRTASEIFADFKSLINNADGVTEKELLADFYELIQALANKEIITVDSIGRA